MVSKAKAGIIKRWRKSGIWVGPKKMKQGSDLMDHHLGSEYGIIDPAYTLFRDLK